MKKRILTLLLAILLLSTACSETTTEETPESPDVVSAELTETVPEETEETIPPHGLPEDKDFGGAAFRVTCFSDGDVKSILAEETTGEAVNDAIFNRNTMLMDKYNFTMSVELTTTDYTQHSNIINKFVVSGDDAYELVYGHVVGTCNNALNGNYYDWYSLPHIQTDMPWWPQQSVEDMTVYGKMFTICTSINYNQLAAAKVVIFNKDLLTDFGKEYPYNWVREGTWTIDKLISETKDVYTDTNGDGIEDHEDIHGYTSHALQNGFLVSCNTPVLSPTEDGGREITVMTDRTVTLVEKVYDWYYESEGVYLTGTDSSAENYFMKTFSNGKSLYVFGNVSNTVSTYRDSEISYGLVPQPKFDENQENYALFACPSLFSIPVSCQNTDMAGFLFEIMTYYGYYDVIPVYYETTLKGKIADAPDDVEMLEIINDHLTVSFAYCYDNWQGFAHFMNSVMGFNENGGSKDVASKHKAKSKSAQKRLEKCLAAFVGE